MEEVKAELTAQLENPVAFTIPVLGGIPVSQSVVVSWIIMAALTLAAILLTRNLKPVPGRRQLVLEMFVGLINNFSRDIIGKEWRRFAPWLGTAALYITCANLIGLVGLVPPTKNLNVTAALGLRRLFGNVLAAFIVMELVKMVAPAVVPVAFSLYFDIFDGIIQTIVFVFLTAIFIGEALEEE